VQVRGRLLPRRGRTVVYIKGQEEVATLLRLTGANRALLDFEAGRVARDVRNRLNRLLNAEEANLDRTVRAADRQLRAIGQLRASGELEHLTDGLREVAEQRRRQPDADLDTLAGSLGISRSAVNHRLRRLVALAAASHGEDA
jgi:DNA-binding protein WhiA